MGRKEPQTSCHKRDHSIKPTCIGNVPFMNPYQECRRPCLNTIEHDNKKGGAAQKGEINFPVLFHIVDSLAQRQGLVVCVSATILFWFFNAGIDEGKNNARRTAQNKRHLPGVQHANNGQVNRRGGLRYFNDLRASDERNTSAQIRRH